MRVDNSNSQNPIYILERGDTVRVDGRIGRVVHVWHADALALIAFDDGPEFESKNFRINELEIIH